jgi:hypothetical protein
MDAAPAENDARAADTPCRVCANPIPRGAKKCTHCDEFQSTFWRVAAGFDLKGLLALIPMLALVYGYLADRVEPRRADLQLYPIACSQFAVEVFASNAGNRSAALTSASYALPGRDEVTLSPADDAAALVFAANQSRVLRWTVDERVEPGGLAPHGLSDHEGCKVTLAFVVFEFDGNEREVSRSCACPSLS